MNTPTARRYIRRCTLIVAAVALAGSGPVATTPADAYQATGEGCSRASAAALEIGDRVMERKVAQAQDRIDLARFYR